MSETNKVNLLFFSKSHIVIYLRFKSTTKVVSNFTICKGLGTGTLLLKFKVLGHLNNIYRLKIISKQSKF